MEQEIQHTYAPVVEAKKTKAVSKQAEPEPAAIEAKPATKRIGYQDTWQTIVADEAGETRALYIEKLGCLVEVTRSGTSSTTFIDGCKIGKCADGNLKLVFAG